GDEFGDLYIIERDGNGEPILDANGCTQPIAADCAYVPLLWWEMPKTPGSSGLEPAIGLDITIEEDDPCDVDFAAAEEIGALPREVEFGRLSVARAPGRVLEHSYTEAITRINEAWNFDKDPAGRMMLLATTDRDHDGTDETLKWFTIDSPLENLALYQTLMLQGCFVDLTAEASLLLAARGYGHLVPVAPPDTLDSEDLLQAASFFAAAADKSGLISLDAVINTNSFIGVNQDPTGTGPIEYFDFGDFEFSRQETYPPTLRSLLLGPTAGCTGTRLCYTPQLRSIGNEVPFQTAQVCRGGVDVTGMDAHYGGANWFAEAAENSRAVIDFVHNWALPEY
ncbi:MAG: hypothetical protein KDD47_25865, partial [Acidobacteria bacterium]|nr:hypothetical protein [Acidobacteriota bacterium]